MRIPNLPSHRVSYLKVVRHVIYEILSYQRSLDRGRIALLTRSLSYHRLINWTNFSYQASLYKISTMAKSLLTLFLLGLSSSDVAAFSLSMSTEPKSTTTTDALGSRRSFLSTTFATAVVGGSAILSQNPQPSYAAPEILNTPSGIKYAITKESKDKKPIVPLSGEFMHIEE